MSKDLFPDQLPSGWTLEGPGKRLPEIGWIFILAGFTAVVFGIVAAAFYVIEQATTAPGPAVSSARSGDPATPGSGSNEDRRPTTRR